MGRSERATVWLLVALCVAVRLAFFLAVQPWDPAVERETLLRSDALSYHRLAVNLLEFEWFTPNRSLVPETLRTPLYPAFVAGVYLLFGGPVPWAVLLFQIALAGLSCGVLHASARRVLGAPAALVAALCFALDPTLVYSAVTLMSETLFVACSVVALYALTLAIERRFEAGSAAPIAAAAVCFALAALVRPIAVYLPAPIALFLWLASRHAPRRALAHALLFAAVFAATLAPWSLRNLVQCGTPAISSSGAYNLLVLNVGPMEMERRGQPMEVVKPALLAEADAAMRADGLDPERAHGFAKAPYQLRLARGYIAERPLAFAKFYAFGVFTSFTNLGTRGYADSLRLRDVDDARFDLRAHPNPLELLRAAFAHKTAAELVLGALLAGFLLAFYPCVAAGGAAGMKSRIQPERMALGLCALLALYFVALTGPAGLARFKIAALPYLDLLAGTGAVQLYALWRRRTREVPEALPA
jgi:4-amino-4-deoxy-L-arabinose transferase-like glycosyltransferase